MQWPLETVELWIQGLPSLWTLQTKFSPLLCQSHWSSTRRKNIDTYGQTLYKTTRGQLFQGIWQLAPDGSTDIQELLPLILNGASFGPVFSLTSTISSGLRGINSAAQDANPATFGAAAQDTDEIHDVCKAIWSLWYAIEICHIAVYYTRSWKANFDIVIRHCSSRSIFSGLCTSIGRVTSCSVLLSISHTGLRAITCTCQSRFLLPCLLSSLDLLFPVSFIAFFCFRELGCLCSCGALAQNEPTLLSWLLARFRWRFDTRIDELNNGGVGRRTWEFCLCTI